MKKYRKTLAMALVGTTVAWATPAIAQDGDTQSAGNQDGMAGSVIRNRLRSSDRILSRVLDNPDLVSEELQAQVEALQASIDAIHEAWIAEYYPGSDATVEEIQAARTAFQEAYAEQIAANKELRIAVMTELRAEYRNQIDDSEWSDEAKALYQEYNDTKQTLAAAWTEIRATLGEDATREEIIAARELFREENAELIAQQKELAIQIRELVRESRGGPLFERGPLSDELMGMRQDVAAMRSQVRERRQLAREEMQGMTAEEREEYRAALLEDLKDLHDDIKQRRRQLIEEVRAGQDGDRRPGG